MIKILFTSVGRRVELIQAFKDASIDLKIPVKLYGADMLKDAPALRFCDEEVIVPKMRDENYIPTLLKICESEHINALIPTIDTDLLILSQHIEAFKNIGTIVFISQPDKISLCRDKRLTYTFFKECGLNAPKTFDNISDYDCVFPCFIKPKDGSSSINAFRADTLEELQVLSQEVPDYIIQHFIAGTEYTVDILCDLNANPIYIVPRIRLAVRSGEVLKTKIVYDSKIISESKKLIKKFHPVGAITVQLIRQQDSNEDFFIEINPRFGGGAPLSMKAGANSATAIIKMLDGQKLSPSNESILYESIYSRFDQSVLINTDISQVKAVIFDLDDTLYNEIDYVKSGYHIVADYLSNIVPETSDIIFEKMMHLFYKKQQVFDILLSDLHISNPDTLSKCIYLYRTQMPNISLSDTTKKALLDLKSKGYKLGIITDGRVEGQRAKITALGLDKIMDEIIITDELGGEIFRKPNDVSFRIMKYRMNLPYAEMLYVGDNSSKDFIAPKSLGMQYYHYDNKEGLYRD